MTNATLTLDVSDARAIDAVGAELLLRVFNAFKRASHELIVQGADQLLNPLRSAIEPGRRDSSDACWMLLLDVHRLLNRQNDFEETGIQYCITYEVSPPSWEPFAINIKTRAFTSSAPGLIDPLDWRGDIGDAAEPPFARMPTRAPSRARPSGGRPPSRRIAFSAP